MMARLGLFGRIMLLVLAALSTLVLATVVLDHLQSVRQPYPWPTRFPRVDQAANIVRLLRDADPNLRPQILKAVSGISQKAEIVDTAPAEDALIREPRLESRLRLVTGEPADRLRAFTDTAMLHTGAAASDVADKTRRWPIGRLAVATYKLPDGRTLVISAVENRRSLMPSLLGLPLSSWVAILGVAVAALVLLGARHEFAPLRRLTDAVSRFEGHAPEQVTALRGAPEIRRLAQAVQAMQTRMIGLMAERSLLIGAISHDLKTYMTRLRLRAEGVGEPARRDRLIEDLDAMATLIDTSLSFARGTAVEVSRSPLDLADLVAVEVAEHAAQGARISLIGDDVKDALIGGDAVALHRVISNLIENAIKFGRRSVSIEVKRVGDMCQIIVEDDGPGIPEAERPAVFSPFYRVERSRNRQTGGTGLGLAIARQITEAHGGTIVAEAAALGGARLVVTLPAVA